MTMPNDINELDVNDVGLKGIFGDRFHDATEAPAKAESASKPTNTTHAEKTAQNPVCKPVAKLWEPPKPDPNWMDKLKGCVKCVALFGGLCLLFFYWQQTGQMEASAAVPSMCVCTALAGWGIGKNAAWGLQK